MTKLSVEGPGKPGHVSSFSVTENASLIEISGSNPGGGSVSMSVGTGKDIESLMSERFTLTDEKMGSISGMIESVDPGVSETQLTGQHPLAAFNVERTATPMMNQTDLISSVAFGPEYGTSFAFDPDGNIYTADSVNVTDGNVTISKYSPSGTLLLQRNATSSLQPPTYVTSVRWYNNRLYVSYNREMFVFNSALTQLSKTPEPGGFIIMDFFIDPLNNNFVIVARNGEGGPYSIRVLGPTFATVVRSSVGASQTTAQGPVGIAYISPGIFARTVRSELNVIEITNYRSDTATYPVITERFVYRGLQAGMNLSVIEGRILAVDRAVDGNPDFVQEFLFLVVGVMGGSPYSKIIRFGSYRDPKREAAFISQYDVRYPGGARLYSQALGMYLAGYSNDVQTIQVSFAAAFNQRILVKMHIPGTVAPYLKDVFDYYVSLVETDIELSYLATANPQIPAPGWKDSVWNKLNELCVAYNLELRYDGEKLIVQNLNSTVSEMPHRTVPQVSISQGSARRISVQYTRARYGWGVLFDAYEQEKRLSVNAGEKLVEPFEVLGYPISVEQPNRITVVTRQQGSYTVTDANGLVLPAGMWENYGGSVEVTIDHETPRYINIEIVGPIVDIPSQPGPYTLDIRDGDKDYSRLSVTGYAVFEYVETEIIDTGADPRLVLEELDDSARLNPFVLSRDQAYLASRWSVYAAGGPVVEISFSVAYKHVMGLGLTAGVLFLWDNAEFRITRATFNQNGAQITAVLHARHDQFLAAWAGYTGNDFADFWAGYRAKDFHMKPLKSPRSS